MFKECKTKEEVTRLYTDHLESLVLSGQKFDEMELRREWQNALDALDAKDAE